MMAANNQAESILSNTSGIFNQGAINDSSSSSVYNQDSSNSSDHTNEKLEKLVDLNERNLAMSSAQIDQYIGRLKNEPNRVKDVDMSSEFETGQEQELNQQVNQQVIQDYVMQNYLYNDYKSFAEDTKSMTSIMTSMSTRKTFDFLSKILPVLVFLLIVFLMIHFILYVRDIEPLNQLTEIICIALACVVFTLSSAFIMKIFCDSKHAGTTWNPPIDDDYIYPRNFNNSYVYSNGLLEPAIDRSAYVQQPINQQPQSVVKKTPTNSLINSKPTDLEAGGRHYYVDAIGNRIFATQLPNHQDNKAKRYTRIDPPTNPPNRLQFSPRHQATNQPINQLITQQPIAQHRRNSSFSQRTFNGLDDKRTNQFEQCIQTINLNGDPIKETST